MGSNGDGSKSGVIDPRSFKGQQIYEEGLKRIGKMYPGHLFVAVEEPPGSNKFVTIHFATELNGTEKECGGIIGTMKDGDGISMSCSKCGKITPRGGK